MKAKPEHSSVHLPTVQVTLTVSNLKRLMSRNMKEGQAEQPRATPVFVSIKHRVEVLLKSSSTLGEAGKGSKRNVNQL